MMKCNELNNYKCKCYFQNIKKIQILPFVKITAIKNMSVLLNKKKKLIQLN